jgi:hypothetical protein
MDSKRMEAVFFCTLKTDFFFTLLEDHPILMFLKFSPGAPPKPGAPLISIFGIYLFIYSLLNLFIHHL